ncbi:23S rRNA (guanosine(2251)-2'-O)-methyltransferase RlmB [candidate division KSB1 bacterium]|nr:MAG: 23S rRNA (guanosine(2251)-2'-O)-methyltransferase RlmB [candidate division KSB1 bacterium]RKY81147.1 MAG: 23S rRNA (guanosine(2251)-2'-O)-methyltransferase RlmB [candidate division KSB1 bacterium]RKY88336.1 MAG: 23S rRNA (guanosine(2251)-2'-O)-methyltransferase RlmB [candidate division KSB1 bacterium]
MAQTSSKIYGINPVKAALEAKRPIEKLWVVKSFRTQRLKQLVSQARQQGILVQYLEKSILDRKAETPHHQGVIAVVAEKDLVEWEDLLSVANDRGEPTFLTILDGIEDPHNLGAIVRSAVAAGVHGLILSRRHCAPISPVVSKTAAGALEFMAMARVGNLARTIEQLKQKGLWIIGADVSSATPYWEVALDMPLAIVIGSEGKGLRRLVREKCDILVSIPMYGKVQSLNATVAAALMFYEVRRYRLKTLSEKKKS